MLNFTSDFGRRALLRLQTERVIWLVTVRDDGSPQPIPVWFSWEADQILIFSQPEALKMRNLSRNQKVALHFDSDGEGGDIVILRGEAEIDPQGPSEAELSVYLEKYAEGLERIGMTREEFVRDYRATIRIRPNYLGGH